MHPKYLVGQTVACNASYIDTRTGTTIQHYVTGEISRKKLNTGYRGLRYFSYLVEGTWFDEDRISTQGRTATRTRADITREANSVQNTHTCANRDYCTNSTGITCGATEKRLDALRDEWRAAAN